MSPPHFKRRYFVMAKADIAYLRFILESYDGLAFQRTLDSAAGLVEILWPTQRTTDVEALLASLSDQLAWRQVPPPAVVPPF